MSQQGKAPRGIGDMRRRPMSFAEVEHAGDARGALRRLTGLIVGEKGMLAALLAATVFGTGCTIAAPAVQSRAVDLIASGGTDRLGRTLLLMLAFYLLGVAGQMGSGVLSARLSQRMVRRLRGDLFGRIIELPVPYLDTHSHGDVMSRMTSDAETLSQTVAQSLPSLTSGLMTVVGTAAVMFAICPPLAALSLITVFLTTASTRLIGRHVRVHSRRRQALLGKLNGGVEEMVTAYRTLQAYGREDTAYAELSEAADELTKESIRAEVLGGIMGPAMNCIGNIGFVIIAAFGGWFASQGIISIGVISAFIVYAKQFSRPINELAQLYGQLQSALAAAERVFQTLDEPQESQEGASPSLDAGSDVSFRNVCFGYVPDKPVLKNFSLDIPQGRKVALVGATGSGKTTVVNLLERFYDPDSGSITVGGQDIRTLSRKELRRRMAIVLQDTVLFTGTVKENLLFADENAGFERLTEAARLAKCRKMIEALPDGWHTVLEGGGKNVSQGQRQLLAIARAFVSDPEILILDEATSNVDTRTEKAIQTAMQRVMRDRTSIVIAHRLSTIRDADLIVVMDHGEIVEKGNHAQLLAARGKYYELVMTQYRGIAT